MSIARSATRLPSLFALATLSPRRSRSRSAKVPFRMGIPVAPQGLADKPLADGPFDYATGEGQNIRVTVLTKALSFPFTLTFLPDGTLLITQRDGKLRVMRNGKLDPNPVAGGPASFSTGTSGLPGAVHGYMDIALHPQFAQNQTLYLSYTKPLGDNRTTFAVTRAQWTGTRARPSSRTSSSPRPGDGGADADRVRPRRHALHRDERRRRAGRPNTSAARCCACATTAACRTTTRSSASKATQPRDLHARPSQLARPRGASRHRRDLAERERPERRRRAQHHPRRQELRLAARELRPHAIPARGRRSCRRTKASSRRPSTGRRRSRSRASRSTRATSCRSGRATCSSAACARARSRAPGKLDRVLFNPQMEELRRESLLVDLRQRVRDVQQGPDGLLYVITDEDEGAVLRIEPK